MKLKEIALHKSTIQTFTAKYGPPSREQSFITRKGRGPRNGDNMQ